ncbi:hypothetical protein [Bacillus sp. ISL-55]|uniref:hypothetical protein n=1 Tax=Bacillus sp. ISL-55 TaxID=2819134 RepID=UPI001BE6E4AD|nr:hypothetical protein [Bacillus sp. ISL-55]MBT2692684.1 hypothetical protein [Bacillus sp. ISL-55]
MVKYQPFRGVVTMINDFLITPSGENEGCYTLMSVIDGTGRQVNFVVEPKTYFVDQAMVRIGDQVTGYYDADAPVPLIYPPQYRALVMVKETPGQNVKVDFFNSQLISIDGMLKLNLSPGTPILLENGQRFTKNPANRNLIVVYGPSTFSIPAQTTPYRIIVLC